MHTENAVRVVTINNRVILFSLTLFGSTFSLLVLLTAFSARKLNRLCFDSMSGSSIVSLTFFGWWLWDRSHLPWLLSHFRTLALYFVKALKFLYYIFDQIYTFQKCVYNAWHEHVAVNLVNIQLQKCYRNSKKYVLLSETLGEKRC